jgi:hypothetical protein
MSSFVLVLPSHTSVATGDAPSATLGTAPSSLWIARPASVPASSLHLLILVHLSSLSPCHTQSPPQTLAASPAPASPSPVLYPIGSLVPAAREGGRRRAMLRWRPAAEELPSSLDHERATSSAPNLSAACCSSPTTSAAAASSTGAGRHLRGRAAPREQCGAWTSTSTSIASRRP